MTESGTTTVSHLGTIARWSSFFSNVSKVTIRDDTQDGRLVAVALAAALRHVQPRLVG